MINFELLFSVSVLYCYYQLKNEVSQNNFNMYARIYNQQPFPGSMVEQSFTSDCSCCKCHSYSGDDEDDEEGSLEEAEGEDDNEKDTDGKKTEKEKKREEYGKDEEDIAEEE